MTKRVTYIFPVSHHYRLAFHEGLRAALAKHDIDYRVIYSPPFGENLKKKDTVPVPWGYSVPLSRFSGLQYQHALQHVIKSDLVIVQQENKLLINYMCQLLSLLGLKKVAFFGHGKNFQALDTQSRSERWKRFWATKVNWWFGYTNETAKYITALGFPKERCTVFNNAIDTKTIMRDMDDISADDYECAKSALGISGDSIGVYVGGMYKEKRITFLIEAAVEIRRRIPDFHLVMIGGGNDAHLVVEASKRHDWLHYVGPKFGKEKTILSSMAKVFLMPGLVGLGVIDAFIYRTPMVTTDLPYHSPEIAYLEDGVNGVVVKDSQDVDAYASAVCRVLSDDDYYHLLRNGCDLATQRYSIEKMVARFEAGILAAVGKA